jgi:hypothetical protein
MFDPLPLLLPLLGISIQGGAPALPESNPEITRAELEHHVRFLASDENEGRPMYSDGIARAADYLARALAQAGLEPGGPDGSWFQKLALTRVEYPETPRLLWKGPEGEVHEAQLGVDFDLEIRGRARSTEMLPVRVFYDYTANRIPGKGDPEMAIFFGIPQADREAMLARYKIANLEDWGLEITVRPGSEGYQQGKPSAGPRPTLVVGDQDGCERVELRGELRGFLELGKVTHVQLLVEEVEVPTNERNVVGVLRGRGTVEDPGRAREVVLLSAHYDHIGTRGGRGRRAQETSDRDRLCNGADDNASGCAALLELAQACAQAGPPARTLVVLFTTGEESGGHGIRHYIAHPVAPLADTVVGLNLEMVGRPDPEAGGPGHLWLTGDDRSTLLAAWAEQGLAIGPDPHPRERFFYRSDNFALALEGVVAQTLSSFGLHEDYHRPSDEADTLDYTHLETVTRLTRTALGPLLDGTWAPAWLEGKQPLPLEERVRRGPPRRAPGAEGREARDNEERGEDEDDD